MRAEMEAQMRNELAAKMGNMALSEDQVETLKAEAAEKAKQVGLQQSSACSFAFHCNVFVHARTAIAWCVWRCFSQYCHGIIHIERHGPRGIMHM